MITFAELKNNTGNVYPAILLEKYFPFDIRRKFLKFLKWAIIVFLILVIFGPILYYFSYDQTIIFKLRSFLFILFFLWITTFSFQAFYFSYYFGNWDIDFEVSKLVNLSPKDDLLLGFLKSAVGKNTLSRLGISPASVSLFLKKRENKIKDFQFEIITSKRASFIDLKDYIYSLYKKDIEFQKFLEIHSIDEALFFNALDWIIYNQQKRRETERWWTREALSRIPSIGRRWSFDKMHLLEKNGHSISSELIFKNLGYKWKIYNEEIEILERIMIKQRGSNVILISDSEQVSLEFISAFYKMILSGKIISELENKRVFVLDYMKTIKEAKDRGDFENNLKEILIEVDESKNIILVIPRLNIFVENTHKIGVEVEKILSDFLSSKKTNIICTISEAGFYETVNTNYNLVRYFEKIKLKQKDQGQTLRVLQEFIFKVERKHKILFTYQSIKALSDRLPQDNDFFVKLFDYSDKIIKRIKKENKKIIFAEDVTESIDNG